MSLYEILKYMYLPLRIQDGDVKRSLISVINNYYERLAAQSSLHYQTKDFLLAIKPGLATNVLTMNNGLISAIQKSKFLDQSYLEFSQAVHLTYNYLSRFPISGQVTIISPGEPFYRVRPIKEGEKPFGRKELFHIPFDELYKVRNYRYSLQKEPALYLSTSVPLALLETRLKNVKYAVARFEPTEVIKIINVDYSYFLYPRFEEVMHEQPQILQFLGISWPLIAACSIKVHSDHESNDLKEEYIIPQLLMRYVQERADFQGIRFYSTRIDFRNHQHHKGQYNLVLPTKMTASNGYDENLKKLFKMTDIVSVEKGEDSTEIEQKLKQMPTYDIDF